MEKCDAMSMSEFRNIWPEDQLRSISKEYYEWKAVKNPFQQGEIYLERKDDIVIGSTTITPKKISILGEELIAAEIGDTFTHPDYQRQGVFSKGVNECTKLATSKGIEVIYGTPNSQSLPGYQHKLGYPPCPFVKLSSMTKHRWNVISTIKSILKLILRRKVDPFAIYFISFLREKFSRPFFSSNESLKKNKGFDISTIDNFTDELDGYWGKNRYHFFTIRDNRYLNWRYFENPEEYQALVAKKGGKYLGYLVTKISKDKRTGAICDFITIDDRLDVFYFLIQEAEKKLFKAGVQAIY